MLLDELKSAHPEYQPLADDKILELVKAKYPEYQGLPDSVIAAGLNRKFGRSSPAPAAPRAPMAGTFALDSIAQPQDSFSVEGMPQNAPSVTGEAQDPFAALDGTLGATQEPQDDLRMLERSRRQRISEEFGAPGKEEFDPLMGFKAAIHGVGPWAEMTARGLEAQGGPLKGVWGTIADTVQGFTGGRGYMDVQDAAGGTVNPFEAHKAGEAWNTFMANLGLNAPNQITAMGATALGAAIGTAIAPGIGTLVGGALAGMWSMSLPETGNFVQTAKSLGIAKEDIGHYASLYGSISGVVEYAEQMLMAKAIRQAFKTTTNPVLRRELIKQALADAEKSAATKPILSFLKQVFGEGFEEFAQEGAQVFLTNQLIKKLWSEKPDQYNPENLPLQSYDSMKRAGVLGALVGAGSIGGAKAVHTGFEKIWDYKGQIQEAKDKIKEISQSADARSLKAESPSTPQDIVNFNNEFDNYVANEWNQKAEAQRKYDQAQLNIKRSKLENAPLFSQTEEEMFHEDWNTARAEHEQAKQEEARKLGISENAYKLGLTAPKVHEIVAHIISGKGEVKEEDFQFLQNHRPVIEKNLQTSLGAESGKAGELMGAFVQKNVDAHEAALQEANAPENAQDEEQKAAARKMGITENQFNSGITPILIDAVVKKSLKEGKVKFTPEEVHLINQAGDVFRNRLQAAIKDPTILQGVKHAKTIRGDQGVGAEVAPEGLPGVGKNVGQQNLQRDKEAGRGNYPGVRGQGTEGIPAETPPKKGEEGPGPSGQTPSVEGKPIPIGGAAPLVITDPKVLAEKYGVRYEKTAHGEHSFTDLDLESSFPVDVNAPLEKTFLSTYTAMLRQWASSSKPNESGPTKMKLERLETMSKEVIPSKKRTEEPEAPRRVLIRGKGEGAWENLNPEVATYLKDMDVEYRGTFKDPVTGETTHTLIPLAGEKGTAPRSIQLTDADIQNIEAVKKAIGGEIEYVPPPRKKRKIRRPGTRQTEKSTVGNYIATGGKIDWRSVQAAGLTREFQDMPPHLFTNYPYTDTQGRSTILRKGRGGMTLDQWAQKLHEQGIIAEPDTRLISQSIAKEYISPEANPVPEGPTREQSVTEEMERRVDEGSLKVSKIEEFQVGDTYVEDHPLEGPREFKVLSKDADGGMTVRPANNPHAAPIKVDSDAELYVASHQAEIPIADRQEMLQNMITTNGDEVDYNTMQDIRNAIGNVEVVVESAGGNTAILDFDTITEMHHLEQFDPAKVKSYHLTGKILEETATSLNPSREFIKDLEVPGLSDLVGPKRKPREQFEIPGLGQKIAPTGKIKPKGVNLGTEGLPIFEGEKPEVPQGDIFDQAGTPPAPENKADILKRQLQEWRRKNEQSIRFDSGKSVVPAGGIVTEPGVPGQGIKPQSPVSDPVPAETEREITDRRPEPRGDRGTGDLQHGKSLVTARLSAARPADRSVVTESISRNLMDHQVEGYAAAVEALDKEGGFLIGDGTGVGKTREELAVAEHYRQKGMAVIIVTRLQVLSGDWKTRQFYGSFKDDAKAMGVTLNFTKDMKQAKPGTIVLTTYENLGAVHDATGSNTLVIMDESHTIKNAGAQRGSLGRKIAAKAGKILFASATATDKLSSLNYLARIGIYEGRTEYDQMKRLGFALKKDKEGNPTWTVNSAVGEEEVLKRVYSLFDRLTTAGKIIKREISLQGIPITFTRVHLASETFEKIRKIETAYEEAFPNGIPGNFLGVMLMEIRRQCEVDKVPHVMEMVKNELAAGRKVIVYATLINPSLDINKKIKTGVETPGTITNLKERLYAEGLVKPGRIAEIHGYSEEKNADAIDRFQKGAADVVLCTVESGGAGINLDDSNGLGQRSMIIITPPFSGTDFVQAIGRSWRLKSKTKPNIITLYGNTPNDAWGVGIIVSKLRQMEATIAGEVSKMNPENRSEFLDASEDTDNIADPADVESNWQRSNNLGTGFVPRGTIEPYIEGAESDESFRTEDAYDRAMAAVVLPAGNPEIVKKFYSDNNNLINYEIKNSFERFTNLMGITRMTNESRNDFIRRVTADNPKIRKYYDRMVLGVYDAFQTGIQPVHFAEIDEALDGIEDRAIESEEFPEDEARKTVQPQSPHVTYQQDPMYKTPAETKEGKNLVESMKSDKNTGMRSIIDFLNKQWGILMVQERPSRGAPASHAKRGMITSTKSKSWIANIHEAGHGLVWFLEDKNPGFFRQNGMSKTLTAHAQSPHFMFASAKNYREGFAEFVRLYVENYDMLRDNFQETGMLESMITAADPEILATIKDAARAYNVFRNKTIWEQFQSYTKDYPAETGRDYFSRIKNAFITNHITQGHALETIDRTFRGLIKSNAESKAKGMEIARLFMKNAQGKPWDVFGAYEMTLMTSSEIDRSMTNMPISVTSNGLTIDSTTRDMLVNAGYGNVLPDDMNVAYGNRMVFKNKTPHDIYKAIGSKNWDQFFAYGAFKSAIVRAEFTEKQGGPHAWTGQAEGITLQDMKNAVAAAEKDHPEWLTGFRDVENIFNAIHVIKFYGGRKTIQDLIADKVKFYDYWPLHRVFDKTGEIGGQATGAGRRFVRFDYAPAHGSQLPVVDVMESIYNDVGRVYRAYYQNKFWNALEKFQGEVQHSGSIPLEAQNYIARIMSPIQKVPKLMATVSKEELAKEIAKAINIQGLSVEGYPVQAMNPPITADDVNIMTPGMEIWRSVVPNKMNVIMYYNQSSKQKEFRIVRDAPLFLAMISARRMTETAAFINKHVVPITNAWKRSIVARIPFTIGNFFARDPIEVLSPDPRGELKSWIPFQNIFHGLFSVITGKPNYVPDTELFSRTLAASFSGAKLAEWNGLKKRLSEGLYIENFDKLQTFQKMISMLEPYRAISAVLKPMEMASYMSGLNFLTEQSERLPRRGQYYKMKNKGYTDEWAIAGMNTVSGKFIEHPANLTTTAFYRSIGFLNPSIQTTYRSLLAFTDPDPRVRGQAMLRLGIFGVLGTVVAWSINQALTPLKLKKREKEIPEEEKISYYRLGGFIKMPFAYGITGAVQGYVWNKLDEMAGLNDPVSSEKMAMRLLKDIAFNMPGDPMVFMQPAVKTIVENIANHNFYYGTQIENDWMKYYDEEPWKRAYASTPQLYIALSKMTGMGPLKIQHFLRDGIGYQIEDTARIMDLIAQNRKLPEGADLPLIGQRIARDPVGFSSRSVKQVMEYEPKYQSLMRRYKTMTEKGIKDPSLETQVLTLRVLHNAYLEIQKRNKEIKKELEQVKPNYELVKNKRMDMVRIARIAIENPYYIMNTYGEEALPEGIPQSAIRPPALNARSRSRSNIPPIWKRMEPKKSPFEKKQPNFLERIAQ